MKRFWIGIGVLVILLALGIFAMLAMDAVHSRLSAALTQAADAAQAQDWLQMETLTSQARTQWQRSRCWIAAAASHEPIEEIDGLFDQLRIYLQQRDALGFALCCTTLSARMQALGQTHAVNWWSLL